MSHYVKTAHYLSHITSIFITLIFYDRNKSLFLLDLVMYFIVPEMEQEKYIKYKCTATTVVSKLLDI